MSFHNLDGQSLSSSGITAKEDDWKVYGINFGMNSSENLNIDFDIMYSNIDVTVSGMGVTGTGSQDTYIFLANLKIVERQKEAGFLTGFV